MLTVVIPRRVARVFGGRAGRARRASSEPPNPDWAAAPCRRQHGRVVGGGGRAAAVGESLLRPDPAYQLHGGGVGSGGGRQKPTKFIIAHILTVPCPQFTIGVKEEHHNTGVFFLLHRRITS